MVMDITIVITVLMTVNCCFDNTIFNNEYILIKNKYVVDSLKYSNEITLILTLFICSYS